MEGLSILNTGSFLIPHLPRHALGTHYRCSVWIVLLLHVQESGQKPIAILPYARIGRYVWFNLHLFTHRVGILNCSKSHPVQGAFFVVERLQLPYMVIACWSGVKTV